MRQCYHPDDITMNKLTYSTTTQPWLHAALWMPCHAMCAIWLAVSAVPAAAAERDICDKMVGDQLRRCIEAASRAQSGPPAASGPGAPGVIVLPSPDKAVRPPITTTAGTLNCTKVTYVDQSFCAFRNSALIECGNRAKHPDANRCLDDVMSRAPELVTVDCKALPTAHQASCQQRNRVYASCKNDKMNYLACLETKLAQRK